MLAYRELDDALGLTDMAITKLLDGRRGKNTRHEPGGLFRQSAFGRLAGYEDVIDAERLAHDPAMRTIVGRDGFDRAATSSSQMGRFETEWLATETNLEALSDLSGAWIDRVHARKPPDGINLDMDSSESRPMASRRVRPGTATSAAPVITHCSCSTSLAIWSAVAYGPATSIAPRIGAWCWSQ